MTRIVVLQLCRFGDILQTTPMLRGLRTHYPDAHVTLVVSDAFRRVPVPSDLYDELACLPFTEISVMLANDPDAWPAAAERLEEFVLELGETAVDVTLNLTHSDLASLLAALIPSRDVRGGLVEQDRTRVVRGEVMTYFWASQLAREEGCFNLVDLHNWAAGVPTGESGIEIEVPEPARDRMRRWLSEHDLLERPYIAVQLGASDERKRWPAEHFGEAINMLDPALGEILLVGTDAERELGQRAVSRIQRPVHDSLGQSSIVELAALLESASLLVTNDTGTMHVATAVDTRVLDISTGPVFAHETGPFGEGHLVIEPCIPCFPCTPASECHHLECRETIAPADVAALVRHALGRGPLPQPRTARVLEGHTCSSGRLEYRPLWSPVPELKDLLRPLVAQMWETELVPRTNANTMEQPVGEQGMRYSQVDHDLVEDARAALGRVVTQARRAAELTRGLSAPDPEARDERLAEVGRQLDALRLEADLHPACRSIVAYLRVRLDSTVEVDVSRLSATYIRECLDAARRAEQLSERLREVIRPRLSAEAV